MVELEFQLMKNQGISTTLTNTAHVHTSTARSVNYALQVKKAGKYNIFIVLSMELKLVLLLDFTILMLLFLSFFCSSSMFCRRNSALSHCFLVFRSFVIAPGAILSKFCPLCKPFLLVPCIFATRQEQPCRVAPHGEKSL